MAKQLFGTDGIRGVAGEYPLDAATVHALGIALGKDARRHGDSPEIVVGMDTRESGPWIAQQVAGGLRKQGVRTRFAGVITTPGIAYLTSSEDFVAGVMISASHNPYQDNGIKVFGHSGYKLPDEEEHFVEEEIFRLLETGVEPEGAAIECDESLDRKYLDHLISTVQARFDGMKLVIDAGNGAAYRLAPELLRALGAGVDAVSVAPDGRNINLGCGALHVEGLARDVIRTGAGAGVAFDGDADRAIFVSGSGKVVDGDHVLLLAARYLKAAGRLNNSTVVATVMSNLGLEKALEREGIRLLRTPVGDKYVLEEMLRSGAVVGGEQSGHVIFTDYATTGDGLLTAVRVFEICARTGRSLDELTADLEIFPQKLVNVRVREKKPLEAMPAVKQEIAEAERRLAGSGRVLVRYSGTEPLIRVMVEAQSSAHVEEFCQTIAGAIRREAGA